MHYKIQVVTLEPQQKKQLEDMRRKGRWSPRELTRATILLNCHNHTGLSNSDIAGKVLAGRETVRRVRKRFLEDGLEGALFDKPRPGQPKRLTDKDEAHIIATACTQVPAGYDHWTLKLLVKDLKKKRKKQTSRESVRHVLLRNKLKPWRKKNVVYSKNRRAIQETDG